MIYHCPTCGVYWYILSEYQTMINWKRLGELLITNPTDTIKRYCPNHDQKYSQSAGVKA
jgi:hypothetical protein